LVIENLVKLSSQILVQENDFVKLGTFIWWSNYPEDILRIKGPAAVQQYWLMKFKKYTVFKGWKLTISTLR
jgi:DNA-directed RNA polymerase subunit beta'